MFLKDRNTSSKIKRSKVTDYAALNFMMIIRLTTIYLFSVVFVYIIWCISINLFKQINLLKSIMFVQHSICIVHHSKLWELSGRVFDLRPRGRGFEHHCAVDLEQDTFILA